MLLHMVAKAKLDGSIAYNYNCEVKLWMFQRFEQMAHHSSHKTAVS